MSTKYQRPSGAYNGAPALLNRRKYQDDANSTPRVAISSSKIDGDFNYIIDALNEFARAKGDHSTLAERLDTALNADGSLKSSVAVGLDDWVNYTSGDLGRISDTEIAIQGDVGNLFVFGRRVRVLGEGNVFFAHVKNVSAFEGGTIISLVDLVNSDGVSAVLPVTLTQISYSTLKPGILGNLPFLFKDIHIENSVLKLSAGDDVYGFRATENGLEMLQNTGTVGTPIWSVMSKFDSNGLVFFDGTISFSKLTSNSIATQVEAEEGTAQDKLMTVERTAQAIAALAPEPQDANESQKGVVELATTAEARVGSDSTRAVTPSGVKEAIESQVSEKIVKAKCFILYNGSTPSLQAESVGVSSVTDRGVGRLRLNGSSSFSGGSTRYVFLGSAKRASRYSDIIVNEYHGASRTHNRVEVSFVVADGNFYDPHHASLSVF